MGRDVDDVAAPGIHAPHGCTRSAAIDVPVETHEDSLSEAGCFFLVFAKASLSLGLFAPTPGAEGKSAAGGKSMLD